MCQCKSLDKKIYEKLAQGGTVHDAVIYAENYVSNTSGLLAEVVCGDELYKLEH